jgi:hypothetical protein
MGILRTVVDMFLLVTITPLTMTAAAVKRRRKPAPWSVCGCGKPRTMQVPESGRWVCDGELHGSCGG